MSKQRQNMKAELEHRLSQSGHPSCVYRPEGRADVIRRKPSFSARPDNPHLESSTLEVEAGG